MTVEPDLEPCLLCGYFRSGTPCEHCGGEVLDGPLGQPVQPGRRFAPIEIVAGFVGFFRAGIQLLTRPEYFGRLAVPVTGNLLATIPLAVLAVSVIHPLMVGLIEQRWGALEVLRELVFWSDATFAVALTAAVVVFVAPAVIQTLTIPFLDPLADAVEKMLGGPGLRPVEPSAWRNFKTNVRASAQVLVIQIAVLVPCLLLSFCQLGLVLALLAAACLTALLWFEVPFARRGYTIEQRIHIVRHNWPRALGFGLAFQLGLFVPLFNVLLLAPTAAVAVTMSYFHFEKVPATGIVRHSPATAQRPDETTRDG